MATKFQTKIALSPEVREQLVQSLNIALATALDLQLQIKQAHWNIKGPQFFARHELFDKLAKRTRKMTDEIAERATTLGGYAAGTVRLSAKNSVLPEYTLDAVDGRVHIRTLAERYATYTALLRGSVEQAENLGDPATADLFVEALRKAEMDQWFLESHLNV
jgi:starvation-inducible DNA-binding protein